MYRATASGDEAGGRKDHAMPAVPITDLAAWLDDVPAIVWKIELSSWRFVFVNRQAEVILGYPVEQWYNEQDFWLNHLHPDDREWAWEYCTDSSERGIDHAFEYRMIKADGSVVWMHDVVRVVKDPTTGRPCELRGVITDVTERHMIEQARHAAERRRERQQRALLDLLSDPIIGGYDPATWSRITRAVAETLQVERASIWLPDKNRREMTCHDAFHLSRRTHTHGTRMHKEDCPTYFLSLHDARVRDVSDARRDPRLAELHARRQISPDTRAALEVPVHRHGDLVALVRCEHVGGAREWHADEQAFAASIGDVVGTLLERKARREAEALLRDAQRIESLGLLAGGMAHDFNSYLLAIQGSVELLRELLPAGHPGFEHIETIDQVTHQAAEATRALLTFARGEKGEVVATRITEVTGATVTLLGRLLPANIDLHYDESGARDAWVRHKKGAIQQILLNLVLNARDAMPDGGSLRIWFERHDCQTIDGTASVVLWVADTGTGMDEDTRARIFEPFFTTKHSGRGNGLGLSVVYSLVEEHGGYIQCHSQPGEGTSFAICLPTCEPAAGHDAAVTRVERPPADRTVLVVDDNELVRRLMHTALTMDGYDVIEAATAEDARCASQRAASPLTLLVVDLHLPDQPGSQLAEMLRRANPDLPIVFMTGAATDTVETTSPATAVLSKPFGLDEFRHVVQSLLAPSTR